MRAIAYLFALVAVAVQCGAADAQETIPADIGVTLTAVPSTNLVTGQSVNVTITVTNYGSGAASYLVLQSSTFVNQFDNFVADPNECDLVATVVDAVPTPFYYLNWEIANVVGVPGSPPFAPGETKKCHLQLSLTSQAPAVQPFSFGVPSYFTDINPSNDNATVTLRRAAQHVPALSSTMLLLLAFLVVLTATSRAWSVRFWAESCRK